VLVKRYDVVRLNLRTARRELAIAALLQGWLLCVGFVCLANVLQCAVAHLLYRPKKS